MRRQNLDCTAGRRALQIGTHPERPPRIVDATSRRYGKLFNYRRKSGGRGDPERDALAA